ncbi:glycosyltransferase [Saccharicrinis sp. FJH54]|uniref:glycosyltransferase n=1 Tax=Saccharicrinis sp. FJH54 TaxID=3344665 RepID=UPI0035D4ECDD
MNISHVISSIDKNGGGTSTYLQLLVNHLDAKLKSQVVCLESPTPLPLNPKVSIYNVKGSFPLIKKYSKYFSKVFGKSDTDIFHGNGLWEYPVHAMAQAAKNRNIPYIISPHGMLEPWAINAGKWKKRIAMALFQHADLTGAACLHATAKSEAKNIRNLGYKNPIAIIPNGIDLGDFPLPALKEQKEKRTLLFLSRIHPKKGIEILIDAWEQLTPALKKDWQIEIAGNGEQEYINSLQERIDSKHLGDEIKIIGPQFDKAKLETYHRADLFVLPTYSENFGIVVAEALACGVPVITTKGTPWEELNSHNAGWWIDIGLEPLLKCFEKVLSLDNRDLKLIGKNGRKLVEENYSIGSVAYKMLQLYKWIIGNNNKPDFIF